MALDQTFKLQLRSEMKRNVAYAATIALDMRPPESEVFHNDAGDVDGWETDTARFAVCWGTNTITVSQRYAWTSDAVLDCLDITHCSVAEVYLAAAHANELSARL